MDRETKNWKHAVDRLWAEEPLELRGAAQLIAEITRSEQIGLRTAAVQALPSLRSALLRGAERHAHNIARRRFGAVRDALHALDGPRFGKRRSAAEGVSQDDHSRRLLGLPSGRRLYSPEIQQAYKQAAKTMHPDGGGSEREFHELSAARDALLKNG